MTGVHPSSMSLNKIAGLMPCTSRGSIVSAVEGVYFSTPSGLALVNSAGVQIVTKELIRKDKWNALVQINTLRAAMLGPAYYAFGQAIFGVFQVDSFDPVDFQQTDFAGARNGLLIDPTSQQVAFNKLTTDDPITNVMTDVWSGEIFVIQNGQVQWLDISDVTQVKAPFVWRSKMFQAGDKQNFQAAKVFFNQPQSLVALNPVEVFGLVQTLQPDQWGLFRVYADQVLVMCAEVRQSGLQMRLPSGFKADFWQFEIEARVEIDNIQIATSPTELRNT
jgi:hypothetical protein